MLHSVPKFPWETKIQTFYKNLFMKQNIMQQKDEVNKPFSRHELINFLHI